MLIQGCFLLHGHTCFVTNRRNSHFFRLTHSTKLYRVNTSLLNKFRGSTPHTGQTWRGWKSVLVHQRHANCAPLGALQEYYLVLRSLKVQVKRWPTTFNQKPSVNNEAVVSHQITTSWARLEQNLHTSKKAGELPWPVSHLQAWIRHRESDTIDPGDPVRLKAMSPQSHRSHSRFMCHP